MKQVLRITDILIPRLNDREELVLSGLEERVCVEGPSPLSTRLSMLLSLCFCGDDLTRMTSLLIQWGWLQDGATLEFFPEPLNNQLSWPNGARSRLHFSDQNQISLTVTLALPSSWLGWLRAVAMKQPEILQAVMVEPTLRFRFSLLFDSLFTHVALNYSDFMFGDHAIHLGEKPQWLGKLVQRLQGGFCCSRDIHSVSMARRALLSAADFGLYRDFCTALSSYGRVRIAEIPVGEPVLLIDEEPASFYGWQVEEAVHQAAALYLSKAHVVWIDEPLLVEPPAGVQVWTTSSSGAPLGTSEHQKALAWRKR